VTIFGTLPLYLCSNKNDKAMPKEFKNWIENFSEIEALISDLDLEFTGAE
jgi:hypothetical protein